MKKLGVSLAIFIAVYAVAAPQPAYAAGNFFQNFTQTVSQKVHRLYFILPGPKSGKDVMAEAIKANENVKSEEMTANVDVDLLKDDQKLANVKFGMSGNVEVPNRDDFNSFKEALALNGEFSMEGTTVKMGGDVRLLNGVMYMKVNELPALPNFNASDLKGKWMKMQNKNASSKSQLSQEDLQKLREASNNLVKNAQFTNATKETKNGHSVFVVQATLPKQAIADYVKEISKISSKNSSMTATNQEEIDKSLEKFMDNVSEVKATFWVDRGTFNIRHMEAPLTITVPNNGSMENENTANNPFSALSGLNVVKMNVSVDQDKFNQTFTFEEPTDAQDFEEVVSQMMMKGMGQPSTGTSEVPTLNAKQKLELQKYQQQLDAQQKKLDEMNKQNNLDE
jgi:hypothetical protein